MTATRAVEDLVDRLHAAGLRAETALSTAEAVLTDPERGPGSWVGPVNLAAGVVLWVNLPVGRAP